MPNKHSKKVSTGRHCPHWRSQIRQYPNAIAYWTFEEESGPVAASKMSLSGNLVYNSGFEYLGAGGADVYVNWTEAAGTGAIADETVAIHAGGHAAKVTAGSSANTNVQATLKVKPGYTYSFSFWTRGDGTYGGRYYIYDATNGAIITTFTVTGVTGTTYTQITGTFTAPAACVSVLFRLYCPSTNTGIAYYDDLTITGTQAQGAFDANYVACTLGQTGEYNNSILLDGSTSYVNAISAPFINAFNPAEFSIHVGFKAAAGIWGDGVSHTFFRLTTDANNYILIYKPNTPNNKIYFQYVAGGTVKAATATITSLGWNHLIMSVSKSADELKGYINNAQIDTTITGLGTWITTALPTVVLIGANAVTPTLTWKGNLQHIMVASPFDYPAGRLRIPIDTADVDSGGTIFAGRGSTIYSSSDAGDTWTTKYTVPGSVGIIGRVYVAANDYVYVSGRSGTSVYGLYRSMDGGDNWMLVLSTGEGCIWGIDEDASGYLYAGLHAFGAGTLVQIWKSTDGGATWVKKFENDYSSPLQNHVHDLRYDPRTGYLYATIGDQISEKLLRSVDAGENWTAVSTGGTQLLAMALLGNYVYVGTDAGSGNKIVRFTDDGSPTVTLENILTLPTDEDIAIFGAGETATKIFMLGYKEAKTKACKLYVYDGTIWTTPYIITSGEANRGFYTVSRHNASGVFYVSNDYGSVAKYGIKFTP